MSSIERTEPIRRPRDLHVVVLDELAGRLEHERVLVAAAAPEQQEIAREQDGKDERRQRDTARCAQSLLLVMGPISSMTCFSPSVLRPAIRCAGRRTLPVLGGRTLSVVR